MSNRSIVAYLIGLSLLVHAGYSSFEYHHLLKSNNRPFKHIPIDIIMETFLGTVIIIIGSINSIENSAFYSINNEKLIPDSKYLKPIEMKHGIKNLERIGISEYDELNSRSEFINIIEKRKEYNEWINSQ